jgi:very-short-patch-repair endonuclease
LHFRRQVPFAPYYVDFASHLVKAIIEVDGSQHADDRAMSYDAQRTAFLESRGYRVLRFANADVLNHLDGVFLVLAAELRLDEPPPTGFAGPPSPQGGGSAD